MENDLEEIGKRVLDFEGEVWKYTATKELAIQDQLGMNPTAYYQRLNTLLDSAAALQYAPHLIKRLRRMRESRVKLRVGNNEHE